MKPRFLFVAKYHPLRFTGGAEEQAVLLAQELIRRGWEVHYASEMQKLPDPPVVDGIILHGLPENPSPWKGNRIALRRLLWELRPQVAYNQVFDLYTGHLVAEALPETTCIWATSAEGDGFILPKLKLLRQNFGWARFIRYAPQWIWAFIVAKRGARRAHVVLAQRQELHEKLTASGLRCYLVRNVQPAVPESEIQTHEGQPVVLWAGSIKRWKRPEIFLDLAQACRDLNARFVMIGSIQEDRYHSLIHAACRNLPNFRYDGFIPLAQVGDHFRTAHLFVSTSIAEGYPTTFIQAWLRGVPVVSLGVNPDRLLTEQEFGSCVRTKQELVWAVRELIRNPDLRRAMGAKARRFSVQAYDISLAVDQIELALAEHGVALPAR